MELNFEQPCKFTLSANEIRQFCECPRRRYYSSRDCLAIRANVQKGSLLLGGAFHSALQYYYTELNKKANEGLAFGYLKQDLKTHQLDVYQLQDMLDEIPEFELPTITDTETGEIRSALSASDEATLKCLIKLYKEQIPIDISEFEVINCEQTFYLKNWPIDNVMYHGYIDMVVRNRNDSKIYFFEHKTCASFRPEIYSRFDIQLHIYSVYGVKEYGEDFGGMILNQVKKAKTEKGYAQDRQLYTYDEGELEDFTMWIKAKTEALVSPDNIHAPCNNYMSCKTCEYQNICMSYGYKVPKNTDDIIGGKFLDEDGKEMYSYDPRTTEVGDDAEG